ncbi:hypothetical protein N7526_004126 [Penicillium atrosanguineum]|nr:hypothetical protein N7526_004126 [Penicillium atrosanguineum]
MSDNITEGPQFLRSMSPDTEHALRSLPPDSAEVFYRAWATIPEESLPIQSMLIKQSASILAENTRLREAERQRMENEHARAQEDPIQQLAETLRRMQTGPVEGTPDTSETTRSTLSRDGSAQKAVRKAVLKNIRPIENYQGAVKSDAARKYLRDCERYFREISSYAGAEPDDSTKIIHASGRLLKRAAETWRAYTDQVAGRYGEEITTWQAYKDWINREFSEHLGPEKRWDRFANLRQGQSSFHEYAINLQQAAYDCEIDIPEQVLIQYLRMGANVNLQKRWAEDREQDRPTILQDVIQRFIEFERGAMVAGYINRTNPDDMELTALRSRSKDLSTIKCYNCDQKGHYKRNCPAPKKESNSGKGQSKN